MKTSGTDRVSELFEGVSRYRRTLVTPEGVTFELLVASHSERLVAFVIDLFLMFLCLIVLCILTLIVLFAGMGATAGMTILLFFAFLVRNFYFIHFELAWQGQTPGKRICGLRVINRSGGELIPGAVIARNFIREVEFFLPLSLLLTLDATDGGRRQIALLGWALVVASLPLWSKEHLRAGDIIGGTQVIALPKRSLARDLSQQSAEVAMFTFTSAQLAKYGTFELQVLEELLRQPDNAETVTMLADVCQRITKKIDWQSPIPATTVRRFLTDFYTAERAELERSQLYGRIRADKSAPAQR